MTIVVLPDGKTDMLTYMPASQFFKLTTKTVIASVAITAAMYYALACALDGSGQCWQIPNVVIALMIAFMWPWILAVRFISSNIALASVLGFALSLSWVFLIICVGRWGMGKRRKKSPETQNSI